MSSLPTTNRDPIQPETSEQLEAWERYQKCLGVKDYTLVNNNSKLEEYIVVKSIFDQNLSKLGASDVIVFKAITEDVFTQTKITEEKGG